MYCLYNFKFFLLLLVVNIIHKCCKLVLVYHCRYIRHYLLTHSLYRMWYFVYHLCEIVCLMHNHLYHVPQGRARARAKDLHVYRLYNFKFYLLLFVVNIIHKCYKLVLVYHCRYIRHYLLTHSLYHMWYLLYHLCEVMCLINKYFLYMYQLWYIAYHKVICHRTKLLIFKKHSINCKTCTTCNTSFSILDCMF